MLNKEANQLVCSVCEKLRRYQTRTSNKKYHQDLNQTVVKSIEAMANNDRRTQRWKDIFANLKLIETDLTNLLQSLDDDVIHVRRCSI